MTGFDVTPIGFVHGVQRVSQPGTSCALAEELRAVLSRWRNIALLGEMSVHPSAMPTIL